MALYEFSYDGIMDAELCWIDFKDLIDIAEDYMRHCVKTALEECGEEIDFFTKHYQPELKESLEKNNKHSAAIMMVYLLVLVAFAIIIA